MLWILLCASCATRDDRTWLTYQAAGEAASLHARYPKAEELLGRARAEAGARPAERARTHAALARVARERGDLPRAWAELALARAAADALPEASSETLRVDFEAAWLELAEGSAADAARSFERVGARAAEALGGGEDRLVGFADAGRGEALRRMGERDAARAVLLRSIEHQRGEASADRVRPSEPLGLVQALTSLGELQREAGELAPARKSLLEAAALASRELGTGHPRLAEVLAALARVELERGERQAALRAAERAVAIAARRLPEDHPTRLAADAAQALCEEPGR